MKKQLSLFLMASMFSLQGCSWMMIGESEYSCGAPNGVRCASARQIYDESNGGATPVPMVEDEDGNLVRATEVEGNEYTAGSTHLEQNMVNYTNDRIVSNYVTPNLPDRPVPIRTPAEVMRIWVAPWEDKKGDLIMTNYIYTEIEPRRWVLGDDHRKSNQLVAPLEVPTK